MQFDRFFLTESKMPQSSNGRKVPRGNTRGFIQYLKQDITSGLLVFLIALPLCLGIALASGFPPIAGIFTAIMGAFIATCISNSELTIKGPAAGLIVIAIGCIKDFGGDGMNGGWTDADAIAYRSTLAVIFAASILQILFGLLRGGILSEFFPTTVVHGMLAAIGVIIIIKQFPVALGVSAKGEPLEMLREFPHYVMEANPAIAIIGFTSLLIMFFWPMLGKKVSFLKPVPAAIVVVLVAIPMGMGFDLLHAHSYMYHGHEYQLSDQYLVKMPDRVFGMFDDIAYPDFSALAKPIAIKWVLMFFIIGSLESLLSAKAIDSLDPWKRKTNMNRDSLAVGFGNLCASSVGGLPMISEIVRSKANIDNGAQTRFANMWHGVFLLLCVAFIPTILHRIPLAALAAMLVYTGYRLAHPAEFFHVYRTGKEQLAIFVTTLVVVLATDLLIGVAAGVILKMIIHVANGVPLKSLFKPYLDVEDIDETTSLVVARESAVFSNWIPFRQQVEQIGLLQRRNVVIDVSNTKLVDHSVMQKLDELAEEFDTEGLSLKVVGLEALKPFTDDAHATRKYQRDIMYRITTTIHSSQADWFEQKLASIGARNITRFVCLDRSPNYQEIPEQLRLEALVPSSNWDDAYLFLNREVFTEHDLEIAVDRVEVMHSLKK